ncbi:monoamine oxidase [Bradyrhizobium sp. Rc3b]|uniref:RidA family protein n=1 Tax=Bradyrhizobium sp. Rc3b TaxID=1855322 RepID=UPI0008E35C61|nr:RidA family protein [Bradyrhizobium sp. Rc3b]SFM49602.1 monoamine oxidase [Bradyrhizobium sp. Rc3b]
MLVFRNPKTIAAPVGAYSHSVEVPPNARWLYIAGTVGNRLDGSVPSSFEDQHEQVWLNTVKILEDAGMTTNDIVHLNVYATDPSGLKFLRPHREKYITSGKLPGSTWVVVSQLANPSWLVEMETVAAKV